MNPVVPGFHPDPSVCRVGDDYFLACSSFEYFPGVPVFRSGDLRDWVQIGNALDRTDQLRLAAAPSSGGIFAPTLRHHDGRFWLVTTNLWDGGHLLVTAHDPAGPWSVPVRLPELPGIDPDLAWDEDGRCLLTYSVFPVDGGQGAIQQVPIDPGTGRLLGTPRALWSGTGLAYPEAPHVYQVDGRWYLLIAEGGTERGHAVSVARGPSASGPFEGHPGNPVLSNRSTTAPVQNTGHGDLVQAADGTWWLVLLGVRPRGGTPGFHVLGRETFLTRVHWVDGWPVPEPVTLAAAAAGPVSRRDDFTGDALAPGWLAVRQPPQAISSLRERPGWLALHDTGHGMDDPLPAFVGQRQQHHRCRVRALVDPGDGRGGLTVRLDERHHFDIEASPGRILCTARIGPLIQEVGVATIPPGPVVLRIDIEPDGNGMGSLAAPPDRVRLGYEQDGRPTTLAELDGRYLSTEVAGGFTGRVIGIYAQRGTVAADWFEYAGIP
ncbi:MAG: xylan 1,4-beta-xylosidase [Micromonosporaceae bacterium]